MGKSKVNISKELKETLESLSSDLINELWNIAQDHEYHFKEEQWTKEDEFWRQVGYTHRKGGYL